MFPTLGSKWLLKALLLRFSLLLFSLPSPPAAVTAYSTVTHLPGLHGPLPFYLETGYVTVDQENGVELFYYFIKSESNPSEDPVLLWLTGGPMCSVLSGLAFEIGPLRFVSAQYDGSLPKLVYHPYAWTKIANIIFLDSPVGTGFSFSRNIGGYDNVGDISWSKHAYKFLIQWFTDHPGFISNPLYIAGDSYAGKIVPVVAQKVSQGNEAGQEPALNLKGYVIGNPATGDKIDHNARIPYAHCVGIISDELFELAQKFCEGQDSRHPSSAECAEIWDTISKFLSEIMMENIIEPKCDLASPKTKGIIQYGRASKEYVGLSSAPPIPALQCRTYVHYLSYFWANSNITREALHIKKGTVSKWQRCNEDYPFAMEIASTIGYHRNLTSRGYRALVYSGDHDMVVPFLGTQAWTRSLNFSTVDDWRSWHVGGQVAGYTTAYSNNLTFATVKGGGHTAPEIRPKECLAMVRRWLSYEPL